MFLSHKYKKKIERNDTIQPKALIDRTPFHYIFCASSPPNCPHLFPFFGLFAFFRVFFVVLRLFRWTFQFYAAEVIAY